LDVRIKR